MLVLELTLAALAVMQGPVATHVRPRIPRVRVSIPAVRVHVDLADVDDGDADDGAVQAWMTATTDTTIPVARGTRLSVDNFSGTITVTAWDQDRVRVRTGSDDRRGVEVSGGVVTLRVNGNPGRSGGPVDHDISISVPSWMEVDLSGNETGMKIDGVRGDVRAETVEGGVTLRGGTGNISLKSVEGDISIADARGRIELSTVEGAISARNITGDVDAQSVDGEISLDGVDAQSVTASSVDGSIRFAGPLNAGGAYHLESHDGDLTVVTPTQPDAVVSISTFDGEFDSDWPVTVTGTASTRRINFTLGAGKARLELETFDGKIALRQGGGR